MVSVLGLSEPQSDQMDVDPPEFDRLETKDNTQPGEAFEKPRSNEDPSQQTDSTKSASGGSGVAKDVPKKRRIITRAGVSVSGTASEAPSPTTQSPTAASLGPRKRGRPKKVTVSEEPSVLGDAYSPIERTSAAAIPVARLSLDNYPSKCKKEDRGYRCFCDYQTPPSRMIACDGCDLWFHANCVGFSDAECDLIQSFICLDCEASFANAAGQTYRDEPGPPGRGRGRKAAQAVATTNGGEPERGPADIDILKPRKTTWLALCRRKRCPNVARLSLTDIQPDGTIPAGSKYCSDECGILFFIEKLEKPDVQGNGGTKSGRSGAKLIVGPNGRPATNPSRGLGGSNRSSRAGTPLAATFSSNGLQNGSNTAAPSANSTGQTDPFTRQRGEPLHAPELKAIIDFTRTNYEAFMKLGEHPGIGTKTRPLQSAQASPTEGQSSSQPDSLPATGTDTGPSFTEAEKSRLSRLQSRKAVLLSKKHRLDERAKFVALCRANVAIYSDWLDPSAADDKAAAAAAAAAAAEAEQANKTKGRRRGRAANTGKAQQRAREMCGFDARLTWDDARWWKWWEGGGRPELPSASVGEAGGGGKEEEGGEAPARTVSSEVCALRRCDRHKQWQSLHAQDVGLELAECARALAEVEKAVQDILLGVNVRDRMATDFAKGGEGKISKGTGADQMQSEGDPMVTV